MAKAASGKSSSAKSTVVSALEYLADPEKYPVTGVCAVSGDEAFLKSEVLVTLRRTVLAGEEADFSLTTLAGRDAKLRDVADALSTVSLFGDGRRLVIVEEADSFVTEYRAELEDFVTKLCDVKRGASAAAGVLVLDVKTWQSNTRLAKIVAANGLTIQCAAPKERELKTWLTKRAKSEHQVRLD